MNDQLSRRLFIRRSIFTGIGLTVVPSILPASSLGENRGMRLGLVTYQWAKDWDLPTIISNCEKTGIMGVELRTQHVHGVEINLSSKQRAEVKSRFANSPVTCIGYGSNFEFHSPEPSILRENIEQTKAYIRLCKDIGASGIKVKPNALPEDVPEEKTIAQIAVSLNEIGKFAQDYCQLIRVEVHGHRTPEIPIMKAIFDQVTESNVKICWNSNPQDLLPPGLDGNFNMIRKWLGDTVHVHNIGGTEYPFQELFNLFVGIKYNGWILLEESTNPPDKVEALKEQLILFNNLIANAYKT